MKELKKITAVILTYKTSKKTILNCLKSLSSNISIIIVENSKNFKHKQIIKKKFPKIKIFCTGKNLGYGKGNNFGLSKVKTDYALILNPDIVCENSFFNGLSKIIKITKNFDIIGSQYSKDKISLPAGFFDYKKNEEFIKNFDSKNSNPLVKVEWVKGFSMLLNLKRFKKKKIFDEKFFLFFEEIDLCKNIINKGGKIFTSDKLKVHHLGFKSASPKYLKIKIEIENIKNWHWMWSSFYFYKKNYSFLYACYKLKGKFLKSFIKMIFYFFIFNQKLKNKYYFRFLGILNSFIGNDSKFRGSLK